jgi:hypothetical protein
MNNRIDNSNFSRIRMNQYTTDGFGRDTYISYNNGGFWQDNSYGFQLDKFDVSKHKHPHSLK